MFDQHACVIKYNAWKALAEADNDMKDQALQHAETYKQELVAHGVPFYTHDDGSIELGTQRVTKEEIIKTLEALNREVAKKRDGIATRKERKQNEDAIVSYECFFREHAIPYVVKTNGFYAVLFETSALATSEDLRQMKISLRYHLSRCLDEQETILHALRKRVSVNNVNNETYLFSLHRYAELLTESASLLGSLHLLSRMDTHENMDLSAQ